MFKNVTLRYRTINGRSTWRLIGPDGKISDPFTAFAESLRHAPTNTRETYCRHLAQFFDYLIEAAIVIGKGAPLTKLQLTEVVEAYGQYLLMGRDADLNVAREVAATLDPGFNKPSSVVPKKAAVRRFMSLSESIRKELLEFRGISGHESELGGSALFPELDGRRKLSASEITAMQAHSMIAGVVAGGPKLRDSVPLEGNRVDIEYDERRAFPYDRVVDLIDAMPTYRDKTFYALLAASGCRTHEALQVLLNDDLDIETGSVWLVNPGSRPSHFSYRYLTPLQRERLAWKGRTDEVTLLIEPFSSIFFASLQQYLEKEYLAHGKHDFLFQFLTCRELGVPYFLSAAATRLTLFQRVRKKIGVKLPINTGPHSLRHMYGTYALNYFPRANGDYGLPVPMVQQLMAHADIKSTLKYAKFDKDLLRLEIQNANRVLFRHGVAKNLLELKLEALQAQVTKIQSQLRLERKLNGQSYS